VAVLARAGHVLRLADAVVLLPGADDRAVTVLRGLPQPFTVSEARAALQTTRRVVLPLLAHLDRTGRTTRLADDRRRVRGHPGAAGHA
jgi:selenocysteine-specific elongation factor